MPFCHFVTAAQEFGPFCHKKAQKPEHKLCKITIEPKNEETKNAAKPSKQ
jgi:hypothetical protein